MKTGELPRVWWFPSSPGLPRPTAAEPSTYCRYDLDAQPALPEVDAGLTWLSAEPPALEWSIDTPDATPQRRLVSTQLLTVLNGKAAPEALATLGARPELQRKVRSYTGCYLDLGDRTVPTDRGGVLLHFLSDQQWVRHWLVFLDDDGQAPVLSTTLPIGFDLPDDWVETPDEEHVPEVIPLDGSLDLTLSADSVEQFLYRFWIENEVAFRTAGGDEPLTEPFQSYVEQLRIP